MLRTLIGLSFLAAGIYFVIQPQVEKKALEKEQKELIKAFEEIAYANPEPNEAEVNRKSPLSGARGILSIPKIDLEMLVFEGTGAGSLKKGAGLIQPEKKVGIQNIGIAGHRGAQYGKQFNRLDELVINDEISFVQNAHRYTFIVTDKFVVDRTQVDVLSEKGEPYLTLVTCTPVGVKNPRERLIVQAVLQSEEKEKV
jgi:sortase A